MMIRRQTSASAETTTLPLSVASLARMSTSMEEDTIIAAPWWQFHRRLSFHPTTTTSAGALDIRGRTHDFDTIDWGRGNCNEGDHREEKSDQDNDGSSSSSSSSIKNTLQPHLSKETLIIDFGKRLNSSTSNRRGTIDYPSSHEDEESMTKNVSTRENNGINLYHQGQEKKQDELLTMRNSQTITLIAEVQNCIHHNFKLDCQSMTNPSVVSTTGGDVEVGLESHDYDKNDVQLDEQVPYTDVLWTSKNDDEKGNNTMGKSVSFVGIGLDESNDNDDRFINYSFDELLDDDKMNVKTQNGPLEQPSNSSCNKEIIDSSHPCRRNDHVDRGILRPAFRTSKSMEVHDSIWNLSSSELLDSNEQVMAHNGIGPIVHEDTSQNCTGLVDVIGAHAYTNVHGSKHLFLTSSECEASTRPVFHISESMEIHNTIWNLSSPSRLDQDHEEKEQVETLEEEKRNVSTGIASNGIGSDVGVGHNIFNSSVNIVSSVDNLDDVSSIASSIHSGRVMKQNNPRRLSFMFSPPFRHGQRNIDTNDIHCDRSDNIGTTEGNEIDDNHSRTDIDNSSIRSKQPTKRRPSFVLSLKSSVTWSTNNKTKRRPSLEGNSLSCHEEIDYDDEDGDRCLEEEIFLAKDTMNEAIVRDACELMNTVNRSATAMKMEPPFLPVTETFPPFKKLHSIIGFQMDSLNAAIRNPQRTKRKSHRVSKMLQTNIPSPSFSWSIPPPSTMDDRRRLSAYITDQMMQMSSASHESMTSSSSCCDLYHIHVYTSYLPNFMYYQPIASDITTTMRPTSLCSGTGITGKSQYLQPEMLRVFQMFGSYLVGSGHLFREEEEEEEEEDFSRKGKHLSRRSIIWSVIPENENDDDEESARSSRMGGESEGSDPSSSKSGNSTDPNYRNSRLTQRNELIEQIIEDLRSSQRYLMRTNE